jgi:hypothetical protein
VKHRVTLAQKNICALTVASARPLRAWGQPIPSIICAPNVNVGTVWFYELNRANPFDYLTQLQRHPDELAASPELWMPWNYRAALV